MERWRQESWILGLVMAHSNYTIKFWFKIIVLIAVWRTDLQTFEVYVRVEAGKQWRDPYDNLKDDSSMNSGNSKNQLNVDLNGIGFAQLNVGWRGEQDNSKISEDTYSLISNIYILFHMKMYIINQYLF